MNRKTLLFKFKSQNPLDTFEMNRNETNRENNNKDN